MRREASVPRPHWKARCEEAGFSFHSMDGTYWDESACYAFSAAEVDKLEAVTEGAPRDALFKKLLEEQYRNGEAINVAAALEIDAVIDPAQTRAWLTDGLAASANRIARAHATAGPRYIDAW